MNLIQLVYSTRTVVVPDIIQLSLVVIKKYLVLFNRVIHYKLDLYLLIHNLKGKGLPYFLF